jgi:4'-phosphopantetheinyl transferase
MAASNLQIWMTKLTASTEQETFDARLAEMPEAVRQELLAYKRRQDARASLAGKLLLKHALLELNLPFTLNDIRLQDKERPYIHDAFDFNISHSGEYVALALSAANRVGIDLEKHRKLDITLFRKYFSDPEWDVITVAKDPLPDFFRYWAIKESAIKCDGRGVEVLGKTQTRDANTVECDSAIFNYSLIDVEPGYACAVCSQNEIAEIIRKEIVLI